MLSKSKNILMILNSKQKRLYQLATAEHFPTRHGNSKKWQKGVWVWRLRLVFFSLCNHTKPYFLAWWSLIAQAKGLFQDSRELKMNKRAAIFQKLLTLIIRCIKSDKLRQTNCDEFLDYFVMKKAGQNLFNCSLCYVQSYLIWWL